MIDLMNLGDGYMTGYQDFVKIFGNGIFIKSIDIKKNIRYKKHFLRYILFQRFLRVYIIFQLLLSGKDILSRINKISLHLFLTYNMDGKNGIGR